MLLIESVFKRLGQEVFNVEELRQMVADDPAVWDIYAKGLTIGVNQCEKPATMEKLKRYKPRNVSELAAFIAAIRPGFKSMYQRFESREPFSYGIPTLDKLIQTKEIPNSYILFQENLMTILNYASFAMSETYQAVKDIAKKKADKVKALKDKFEEGCTEQIVKDEGISTEEALEISTKIWKIINDSSSYIFNACLAGDTVMFRNYTGYKPITIEEMYQINHDIVYAIKTDHKDLHYKYVNYGYGTAYSMRPDENNLIKRNQIVDIRPAGERETYRLTLESGISVVATMNHKFPTPNGELHLSELKIGDSLYVKDKYKKDKFDATLNKVPRGGGYTIFESFRKSAEKNNIVVIFAVSLILKTPVLKFITLTVTANTTSSAITSGSVSLVIKRFITVNLAGRKKAEKDIRLIWKKLSLSSSRRRR